MQEMERRESLTIERRGDVYLIVLQDFGAFTLGHAFASHVGLEEVEAPLDSNGTEILEVGQFYMRDPASPDPVVRALIAGDQLPAVAEATKIFDIKVGKGAEILASPPAPGTVPTLASFRRRRQPRMKPIWLVPIGLVAALIIGASIVVPRHSGEHRETISMEEAFARAAAPPPPQGTLASLLSPDFWYRVRFEIPDVVLASGTQFVLPDGAFMAIDGVPDLETRLNLARQDTNPMMVEALLQQDAINIERIVIGGNVFGEGCELTRVGQFQLAAAAPTRRESDDESEDGFLLVYELPYDQRQIIQPLIGKPISLNGRIEEEGGRRLLRFEDDLGTTSGIVLSTLAIADSTVAVDSTATAAAAAAATAAPGSTAAADSVGAADSTSVADSPFASASPLEPLFEIFGGGESEFQVDLVLERMFPWKNRQNPAESRQETQLIGEATVYSASFKDLHIVERRLDEPVGEALEQPSESTE